MGAVAIIALFYTSHISFVMLAAAALTLVVLFVMNRAGIKTLWLYLLVGCALWFFMLQSGVHATIAGVLLALFVPLGADDTQESPLERLEHGLSPWVTFLILPIFGFANAGVSLSGLTAEEILSPVPVGVALGLFIGKQVGVFGLSLLAIRSGLARLPESSSWLQLYGVSALCGIGFTMSLFIGNLAFPTSPLLVDEVKIGVLAGSILSAIVGMIVLRLSLQRQR
jgi:NhaA family Na+:H+ antiporter